MPSRKEEVVQAVVARLSSIGSIAGLQVVREDGTPRYAGAGPWLHVGVGDPGEPVDVTLSPLLYQWEHPVPVTATVRGKSLSERTEDLDALLRAVAAAIAADRRLGDTVDWSEATSPIEEDIRVEGDTPARQARFEVLLTYDSPGPLE